MPAFEYGQKEVDYLSQRDERLGRAIERIGHVYRETIPDLFAALVNCIAGQQISMKAHASIWKRMQERLELTPSGINAASAEEIKGTGISMRKAGYIKELAKSVCEGVFDIGALYALPDGEVVKRLTALKGVGEWTAEMLMIFSMQRMDILSWNDLAIRRGVMNLYGAAHLERARFEELRKLYSPYGSVASLYLWELSRGLPG